MFLVLTKAETINQLINQSAEQEVIILILLLMHIIDAFFQPVQIGFSLLIPTTKQLISHLGQPVVY